MNEPFLAHRFQSTSTLYEARGLRLDLARDVVSESPGLALTVAGRSSPALEGAVRHRLDWFARLPLMRAWPVRARAADEHALTLFLDPSPGRPWTEVVASLEDDVLARDLAEVARGLTEIEAAGRPPGGLQLPALARDEDGPFFLPSAVAISPHLDAPGRRLPHGVDVHGVRAEVAAFMSELTEWLTRHRPGLRLPGGKAPPPASETDLAVALEELAESGGIVVVRGCMQLPDTELTSLAAWAERHARPLFVLLEHVRPASIPRRGPDASPAVVTMDGLGTYASFAEGWSALQAAGWIDGRQILIAVVRESLDEAARLYVSSLLHRGRDRLREVTVSAPDAAPAPVPEGTPRRVLEVLSVARRPLGEATLREVCALDQAQLVEAVRSLEGSVRTLTGRVDEGPAAAQLVVALRPDATVELDPAREVEVRRLLGATIESIPGRGLGRGWLLFEAFSAAQPRRVLAAARKLTARAAKANLPLLEFSVHHRLTQRSEWKLRLEDRCRAAISMGKQYMLRGEFETADRIFADALRHMEIDTSPAPARITPLAVELILCTSRLAQQREDPAQGDRILSQAIERHRDELSVAQRASLYLEHSKLLSELGRDREAAARAELTLRIVTPERHPAETAEAHFRLGVCHYRASRYNESILSFQRSLVLWEQEGDDLEASRAYNNISLNYRNMGRLKDAERCLRRSLDLKARVGDSRLLLGGRLNLGYLALDQLNFAEARESGEESLRLARSLRDRLIEAEAYGLLGEAAIGEKRYDEARELLLKDLAICRDVHHDRERLPTLRRLVALLLKLDEVDEAAQFLEEAREVLDTVPSGYETAMLDLLEANLLERSRAYQPALDAAAAAARGFAQLNRFDLQLEALTRRAELEQRVLSAGRARETLGEIQELIARHEIHRVPKRFYTLQAELGHSAAPRPRTAQPWMEETTQLLSHALEGSDGIPQMVTLVAEAVRGEEVFLLGRRGKPTMALVRGVFRAGRPADGVVDRLLSSQDDQVEQGHWMAVRIQARPLRWIVIQRAEPGWKEEERSFVRLASSAFALAVRSGPATARLEHAPVSAAPAHGLIGQSPAIREVLRMVDIVKDNDVTILLLGENGTGKDLVARAIHRASPRGERPLVAINCASIPSSLLESQLFGHEKGAFTSAHEQHIGVFERAHGGTIHLDEIGEMDLAMQAKLLRVLQDRSFTRVGGSQTVHTDVRIIAATNRDLAQEVEAGRFRTDLYYRLNVITIVIPPLRERGDDVGLLAEHFVEQFAREFKRPVRRISREAIDRMKEHAWPGNVRELENVIKNAIVFCESDVLRVEDLPEPILRGRRTLERSRPSVEDAVRAMVEAQDLAEDRPLMPRVELLMAHEAVRLLGNKTRAAKLLGITKPTLYSRLKRYDALYGERVPGGREGGQSQGGP